MTISLRAIRFSFAGISGVCSSVLPAMLLCMPSNASLAQAPAARPVALAADPARDAAVAKLVSQMTLEEKVSQLQNHAAAIPRLGIPAYDYWNEGLHGVARSGYATLFPQAIGLAATWDTDLLHRVATVISTEARAKYNDAIAHDNHEIYYGLTIWSPNINIFRDPRWGRGQETYGEDPFLTSRLGVAFVSGIQGDDPNFARAISTPKHFAVHSGPESSRHKFNVDPSPHDLEDTYLPAFRATITEAHAQSIMCAYNAVDGAPACANTMLLGDLLRKDWKFPGFVTSDCGAVSDISDGHKFAKDVETASVLAIRAGTDTSCGWEYSTLTKAVKDGLIQQNELDLPLQRLFRARYQLGMFDAPKDFAYAKIPFSQVDSAAHRALALKTADEAMVLLKNRNHFLPLKPQYKTIALIGPNAESLAALEGNYNAVPSHPVSPVAGLKDALAGKAKVLYAQGSPYIVGMTIPAPESLFRTAAGSSESGLHAEYFDGTTFAGKPILARTDRQIQFDWNGSAPAEGVPAQSFGVRWTGTIAAPAPGDYTFNISLSHCYPCKDAESYSVVLDGKTIAQEKTNPSNDGRSSEMKPFTMSFADTRPHDIRIEYTHAAPLFGAGVTLNWEPSAAILRDEAVRVAKQSDVVIAFVGLSPDLEGEEMPVKLEGFDGGDRTDIKLPAAQQELLEAVAKTGKPLVVVLMNGSALAVNWADQHAEAILEAWYPGEAGGTAIADTLLGANNPGGRLPVTFYASIDQLPAFDDYAMKNRTYRYMHAKPLFQFGDGLSYTDFAYSDLKLSASKIQAGEPLTVTASVANTGSISGDEVVEAYLAPPASDLAPKRALVGFKRLHLDAQQSQQVTLKLDPRQLSLVDAAGKRAIVPGHYLLYVGSHQPEPGAPGLAFDITGSQELPR